MIGDNNRFRDREVLILQVAVCPGECQAFADAGAGVIGDSHRQEKLMPRRELLKEKINLLRGEGQDNLLFFDNIRDPDVLGGVPWDVFAYIAGIHKSPLEYGAQRAEGGFCQPFGLLIVEKVLQRLGTDEAELMAAERRFDVVAVYAAIGFMRIDVRIYGYVIRQPFGKEFVNGYLRWFSIEAFFLELCHGDGVGFLCLCFRPAAGDLFLFSCGSFADLNRVIPFFAAFPAIWHKKNTLSLYESGCYN